MTAVYRKGIGMVDLQSVGASKRTCVFTLPAGTYRFKVRAKNQGGPGP